MGLERKEVKKIQKEFIKDYFRNVPYSGYINGCAITTLEIALINYPDGEIYLKGDETLDDLCLSVTLKVEPPEDIDFPEEYMGVRVFYQVVGEIKKRIIGPDYHS